MRTLDPKLHDKYYVMKQLQEASIENTFLKSFGLNVIYETDSNGKQCVDFRKNPGIYVWLKVQDGRTVVDAGLARTYSTLKKLDDQFKQENCAMLLHPYAVRIPEGFWSRWKQANTPQDRIKLIKEYNLIKDEAIYRIDKIVLDIDTHIDYARWELENRIFPLLEIDRGYEIGRTKSGNTRVVLHLKWSLKAQDVFRKQKHLERVRELYYLLIDFFRERGLKLDKTFADRLNHPIWFSFNSQYYQKVVSKPGKIPFYTLYGKLKKIQKKAEYWVTKDKVNLTLKFWGDRRPQRKSTKIQLPAFLRNELKQYFDEDYKLTLWKKAVKSLYKGPGNRFTNFILPAIGWAKYLNLNRIDVDMYLQQFLSDRDINKTEKDLDIAWKYANELEFKLPEKTKQVRLPENLDLIQITEKALNYVKQEPRKRQDLLQNIFYRQAWLCDLVMNFLEKKGLVKSEFVKSGKKGRPSKVYHYVENITQNSNKNQVNNQVHVNNNKKNGNIVSQKTDNKSVNKVNCNHANSKTEPTKNIMIPEQNQNNQSCNTINDKPIEDNVCIEDNITTDKQQKKGFKFTSLTEFARNIQDDSNIFAIKDEPHKRFYVYDPVTKQKVLIGPLELYTYERARLDNLYQYTNVYVESYRIPTIRDSGVDYVFRMLFGKFTFKKQNNKTGFKYLLAPVDLQKYCEKQFELTGDYKYLKNSIIKLNFTPYTHIPFRFLAKLNSWTKAAFGHDFYTLKVWVNPDEFNRFYFNSRKAQTYFEQLAKGFYRYNTNIKWHTIKDRKFYVKARLISQKDPLNGTNYWQLLKNRDYWYMKPNQISYESISEKQKEQVFSRLQLQFDNEQLKEKCTEYKYSLPNNEKTVSFTLKNNSTWMLR